MLSKVVNVNHTVASIDKSSGGPARSVTHLIEHLLLNKNIKINLFTRKSKQNICDDFKSIRGNIFFLDVNIIGTLKLNINHFKKHDLFHGHGLWQMSVHQMCKIAQKNNIPYIITPRGMLEPWSLTQSRFKKKIVLRLFQDKDIKEASCIHATAVMEAQNIRNLGYKNPIAIIPNGISLVDFPNDLPIKLKKPKKLLFLSRIHKKKGIENLIDAWALIDKKYRQDWQIDIIGNGSVAYIEKLKEKINKAQLSSQIIIKKPVFGKDKINLFREASLFVLPTFSENFGIVIAEALASYTPVITTKGTPWEDLRYNNCGWWIDIGVNPLKEALEDALKKEGKILVEMGKRGRKLIENKYSMASVALKMTSLYNWILNKEKKPKFVELI